MISQAQTKLVVPALRAHMGDWIYYIAFMTMADIATRVFIGEEIYEARTLKEMIQRRLTSRADQIRDYLLKQPQRFFNALVLGSKDGSPQWYELAIHERQGFEAVTLPEYMQGALGILVFDGSEKIFAIDGQHRVAGIRKAVALGEHLGKEEVATLIVARGSDERHRRLFTTLNRYAKPVNLADIIALDEDDVVAVVTRDLLERHSLFRDKTSTRQTQSLPPTDGDNFTSIVALYKGLDTVLRDKPSRQWNDYKRMRPSDTEVQRVYNRATRFWDDMIRYFPTVAELANSQAEERVAGKYRSNQGGQLLFRPAGLLIVLWTVRKLVDSGRNLRSAVSAVARAPMELAQPPWVGLLWDEANHRMITAQENQTFARKLLFYSVGGDPASIATTRERLQVEYAGLLNREPNEVELPRFATVRRG